MSRNKHESMTRRPCSRHRQPTAALGQGCEKTMRIASVTSLVWRHIIARYVEGLDRRQSFLLPESIQDYVGEDNPVRVIDVFVDRIDLSELGFGRAVPADTGRPGYHPATLLKLYLYGYLNRIPSSRRLERRPCENSVPHQRAAALIRVRPAGRNNDSSHDSEVHRYCASQTRSRFFTRSARACSQLSQMTVATSWIAARKLRAVFSYRVAIARNCLILAKKFSIR